ncbi:MAG: NYN domain-containing protein [Oxalobacter formigenes]|nr:NYN domain-containing protein [Oxalobacter formigenes]
MHGCAILIDAGFAKRKIGTQRDPATSEKFRRLVEKIKTSPELANYRLHRVYFYDAEPIDRIAKNPLSSKTINFGEAPIVKRSMQLFRELAKEPFFSLRLGACTFNGWGVSKKLINKAKSSDPLEVTADDLVPQIMQKGVDMRVGIDIASLTLKNHVRIILLVSGDSDFIPAMKFARREGASVYLVNMRHPVKDGMYEHSDVVIDIDASEFLKTKDEEQGGPDGPDHGPVGLAQQIPDQLVKNGQITF